MVDTSTGRTGGDETEGAAWRQGRVGGEHLPNIEWFGPTMVVLDQAGKNVRYQFSSNWLHHTDLEPYEKALQQAGYRVMGDKSNPGYVTLVWMATSEDTAPPESSIQDVLEFGESITLSEKAKDEPLEQFKEPWIHHSQWEPKGELPRYAKRLIGTWMTPDEKDFFRESIILSESVALDEPLPPGAVPPDKALDPHQEVAVKYGLERPGTIIGDDMGVGKTMEAFGIVNLSGARRVLVVTPAFMRDHWVNNAREWLVNPPRIYKPSGGDGNWKLRGEEDAFVVVGYESLKRYQHSLRQHPWDLMILDEAHKIRRPTTVLARQIVGDDKIPPIAAQKRLALTGTLMGGRTEDMYTILHYVRPDKFPLERRGPFLRDYGGLTTNPVTGTKEDIGSGGRGSELQSLIRSSCFVGRTKGQCLELEDIGRVVFSGVPTTSEQLEAVAQEGMLLDSLNDSLATGEMDVRKFPFHAISNMRRDTALLKRDLVADYVLDLVRQGRPVVLFAHHQALVNHLYHRLTKAGVGVVRADSSVGNTQRQTRGSELFKQERLPGFADAPPDPKASLETNDRSRNVDAFQEGNGMVLLSSFGASGMGYTVTRAKDVVMAELDWTPMTMSQAESRVHRRGQDKPVTVHYVVLQNTIDGRVAELLATKEDLIQKTLGTDTTAMVTGGGVAKGAIVRAAGVNINEKDEAYINNLSDEEFEQTDEPQQSDDTEYDSVSPKEALPPVSIRSAIRVTDRRPTDRHGDFDETVRAEHPLVTPGERMEERLLAEANAFAKGLGYGDAEEALQSLGLAIPEGENVTQLEQVEFIHRTLAARLVEQSTFSREAPPRFRDVEVEAESPVLENLDDAVVAREFRQIAEEEARQAGFHDADAALAKMEVDSGLEVEEPLTERLHRLRAWLRRPDGGLAAGEEKLEPDSGTQPRRFLSPPMSFAPSLKSDYGERYRLPVSPQRKRAGRRPAPPKLSAPGRIVVRL